MTTDDGVDVTDALRRAIEASGLRPGSPHPCVYLPGRSARTLAFSTSQLRPGVYQGLMALNFRRSGDVIYRPACEGCEQCRAIRVPVAEFTPSRAQRRCGSANADVSVEIATPIPTEEKHRLFRAYLHRRHDGEMGDSWDDFRGFLYTSPLPAVELTCRAEGRLMAVGILDVEPGAASAVYCYFDPDANRRSPGVFNVLCAIELCRRNAIPYLYLGYYIRDCRKMNYKIQYRPCEILEADGQWRRIAARSAE